MHCDRPILMLRPLVLTLNHNTRRSVRNAHRRVGGVDMLAAGSSRTISVNPQILLVNLHFDILVDLGVNEERCKRGMTPRILIEWRDADQPVYAGFGRQ